VALFRVKSRVKRTASLEALSMTLKLLRMFEMVDFNSSIANFWPANRKNMIHRFGLKFDPTLNCRRKTYWGEKFKNSKRIIPKNFSYISVSKLHGYVNTCNSDVFSLEIAKQMDYNARLQSASAITLPHVQEVEIHPPIGSSGINKNRSWSGLLHSLLCLVSFRSSLPTALCRNNRLLKLDVVPFHSLSFCLRIYASPTKLISVQSLILICPSMSIPWATAYPLQ